MSSVQRHVNLRMLLQSLEHWGFLDLGLVFIQCRRRFGSSSLNWLSVRLVPTDIDRLWSDVSHIQDLHLRLSPLNLIGCLNLPAKSSVSRVGCKQATYGSVCTGKVAVFCQQNLHFWSIASLKKNKLLHKLHNIRRSGETTEFA